MNDSEIREKTIRDLSQRYDGPDQFQNFDRAFRHSLTLSKDAVVKEEIHQKKLRARRRARKPHS